MRKLVLLFLIIGNSSIAQHFKNQELKAPIKAVTVFHKGANITRTGTQIIFPGRTTVALKGLSPYMDEKSIQVKGEGDFTILSVNHKKNYLASLKKDKKIDSLNNIISELKLNIAIHDLRLEVLSEKKSLLTINKNLGGTTNGTSVTQLREAMGFYEQQLSSIKSEEHDISLKTTKLEVMKIKLENEIKNFQENDQLPTGEVEIRISSGSKTKAVFEISYLVGNAGWFPKYDVRVETVEKPINLQYKAEVYQNTKVDWDNVNLKFSNGNPNQSGVAPKLNTWYLNYSRNTIYKSRIYGLESSITGTVSGRVLEEDGSGIPGVNVVIKGTTLGTVSDVDGFYSLTLPNGSSHLVFSFIGFISEEMPITSEVINVNMTADVTQLQEVVALGYSSSYGSRSSSNYSAPKQSKVIPTSIVENQTTVEFEVETPYSIKSNGKKLSIDLKQFEIETLYEYYAVPKLDKDAFLIARIFNWDQYNLLEGEANLYFEDTYVGRSILNAKALSDTLNISLGRDKNIVIGRMKVDEFSKRKVVGGNKVETRGFEIIARNKKSQSIKLTLFDQLPIPAIGAITVNAKELSNGQLKEKTGEIIWELNLEPSQQVELALGYEVRYPKREKITLE